MNSKTFSILMVILLVFAAGCTVKVGPEGADETDSEVQAEETEEVAEPADCGQLWLQYKEHMADGFSQVAAVALTGPCVETYIPSAEELAQAEAFSSPPSSSTTAPAASPVSESMADTTSDFLEHLNANLYPTFTDLPERILLVKKSSTSATLTYSTSTRDPSQESVYLCGVLLVKYPDIEEANVTGYNAENKEMEASVKNFKRDKYNFNIYKTWFPDYTYNECTEDSECEDANDCTKDFCRENKCYNSKIVNTACPA